MGVAPTEGRTSGQAKAHETVNNDDIIGMLRRRLEEKRAEFLKNHVPLCELAEVLGYTATGMSDLARRMGFEPRAVHMPGMPGGRAKLYVTNEEAIRIAEETGPPGV